MCLLGRSTGSGFSRSEGGSFLPQMHAGERGLENLIKGLGGDVMERYSNIDHESSHLLNPRKSACICG